MVKRKSHRHGQDFTRNVLQDPKRNKEQAAWQFLLVIQELFPDQIEELKSLTDEFPWHEDDELSEEDYQIFRQKIHEWTTRHGIACEAIDAAAEKVAVGDRPNARITIGYYDDDGRLIKAPSITAYPHTETPEEFLNKARSYYDDVVAFYRARDALQKLGSVKREMDHFRWLAKWLIGKQSWAAIAESDHRLGLSDGSIATVARKTARLIGIPYQTKRGPRPGSRHTPLLRRRLRR